METTKFNYVTKVENTPFTIVENDENKAFLAIGNRIITEAKEGKEELFEMVEKKPWNLIINVMCAVMDIKMEMDNNESEN